MVPFEIHRVPTFLARAVNLAYAETKAPHGQKNAAISRRLRTLQLPVQVQL